MAENNKKDNRGYLYPNDKKTKSVHPDYTGTILIDGKEWRLAGWLNKTTDGKEYLSIVSSVPLNTEQQNQYTKQGSDTPAENPIPVTAKTLGGVAGAAIGASTISNNTPNEENSSENEYYNNSSEEKNDNKDKEFYDFSDEIEDILKSEDNDNPFN